MQLLWLRRIVAVAAWLVVLLMVETGASRLAADGKVLAPVLVAQDVAMPDQRALLAWRDGVQTLVIESAFVGEGTEFAWVVPLPAKPEVTAATRGTLASAAALMLPHVVPAAQELWVLVVSLGAVVLTALFAGWRAMGWLLRVVIAASLGLVIGGILAMLIGWGWVIVPVAMAASCWLLRDLIRRETSLFQHLLVVIAGFLLCAITIPTVGKVRSTAVGGPEAGGVTVERGIVGDFDVALLAGTEGDGVVAWLAANGYALPEAAREVALEHARGGGWFVASRVRRERADAGRSVPAPLVFRFAAERPVYPMRFTGAGMTAPLELELFVYGPARAEAEGLQAMAWAPVRFEEGEGRSYARGTGQPRDARVVTHRELRRLAEGTAVVTRLRGTLTPAAMRADVLPGWVEGAPETRGLVVHARESAAQAGAGLAVFLALVAAVAVGFRVDGRRPPVWWSVAVIGVSGATGGGLYAALPTVAVRESGGGIPWYDKRQIPQVALIALGELDPATVSDDAVREAVARELKKFAAYYDGADVELGDGPGQVELVRLTDGKWRVVLHDAAGQAGYFEGADIEIGSLRTGGGE